MNYLNKKVASTNLNVSTHNHIITKSLVTVLLNIEYIIYIYIGALSYITLYTIKNTL